MAEEGTCPALEGAAFGEQRQNDASTHGISVAAPGRDDVREIFLELRAPICRYLVSLGLQRNEAEDIAQESFLRLCEKQSQPSRVIAENVRGWVFRVAQNLALDEHRRRKRRPMEELIDEVIPPHAHNAARRMGHSQRGVSDERPSPEESLLGREQNARLKAALQNLPEQQRQCLHLRAEGLRYREMAEVLGVGTSTVAEWVQKGLKQLERELA